MSEKVIEIKGLTKAYKNYYAIDKLYLEIEKGQIYGLLGRNGAGKTTLMKMLLGLAIPSSGSFFLFGKPPVREAYKRIGSIIETPGFYENLTATENLVLLDRLRNDKAMTASQISKVLNIVSLDNEKNKLVKDYSMGMKQRLGIAAALLHNPDILILDEPINGLDPVGIKEVRILLEKMRDSGTSILISSHILGEIEQICDKIGFLNNGKLIKEINRAELREGRSVQFSVDSVEKALKIIERNMENCIVEVVDNNNFCILNKISERAKINRLLVENGVEVGNLVLKEKSLENYFSELIGGNDIG